MGKINDEPKEMCQMLSLFYCGRGEEIQGEACVTVHIKDGRTTLAFPLIPMEKFEKYLYNK